MLGLVTEPDPVISFLSDFGTADEFVAACKAVMLRIAPGTTLLDISHEIPAHDVRAGSLALARVAQYLPPGVLLAVVDPGVGTDRRAIAVELETGFAVGPDNGLLSPAVAMLGGARRAFVLDHPDLRLESAGATFDGRDLFAPAAGHLASGTAIDELGTEVDPLSLHPTILGLSQREGDVVKGEVLWIDRFGNVQVNIDPDELGELGLQEGSTLTVAFRDEVRLARWVRAYAHARPSELVAIVDSYGLISICLDRRSAGASLRLSPGDAISIAKPEA
jgi:S-adenosyl-L-methionine hydrolase (adenosine-forming)